MMSFKRGRQLLSLFNKTQQIYLNQPKYARALFTNLSSLHSKSVASFEEIKAVKGSSETLLIDVREPQELQETGVIPGSINIPLGEVEGVLKNLSPEDFKKRYGRTKPGFNSQIIFSCRSGKRSANAQEIITKLGFKKIKSYEGGWLDWEERNKK